MKNESHSYLRAFRVPIKRFYHREESRYRRFELTAFAIITLASAFALLDAVASSIR